MPDLTMSGLILVAFVVGAVGAWVLASGRSKARVAAATVEATAAGQAELAQLRERVRAGEEARRIDQSSLADLKRGADLLRDQLDDERDRTAMLTERASRVPLLEQEVSRLTEELRASVAEVRQVSNEAAQKGQAVASLTEKVNALEGAMAHEKAARAGAEAEMGRLNTELAEARTTLEAERRSAPEKLSVLLEAKEALSDQFETLANRILEDKSKRFAEQNQTSLGQLLDPLRAQLTEFKGKVEEVYFQEGMARSALSEQVKGLVALNQTLSREASNLTSALKGQAKTQGNWGELILEQVLEASGLRKGFQYRVQDSQVREDGSRAQPDVVIHLPEDRKLVVDAKVSLVAFERHVSAETDEERAVALRQHIDSLRGHIRGLSEKKYQALYGLQSLDFVIAFVPVEPAFMVAVTGDADLFMDAWQRNVLLVSPSTLLFVVRTVAHLWSQDAQNRNSQEIASRGAELYEKFCGFVADLQDVGKRIDQAKESFDQAERKLVSGRGNVVRQAELLKNLGVKPAKALPRSLLDRSGADEESIAATGPRNPSAATFPLHLAASDGTQVDVGVPAPPSGPDD